MVLFTTVDFRMTPGDQGLNADYPIELEDEISYTDPIKSLAVQRSPELGRQPIGANFAPEERKVTAELLAGSAVEGSSNEIPQTEARRLEEPSAIEVGSSQFFANAVSSTHLFCRGDKRIALHGRSSSIEE